jgi:flavin reductase (DIM6/NTAB) family NADH-FMN oxidoreductase RutF
MIENTGVDSGALRAIMGQFPTGVTVVGVRGEERDQGMTANSLTCVSLEPPLVAICLSHGSRTERAISDSGSFALTFLSEDQSALASHFARNHQDHFDTVTVARTERGHPYLPNGVGFMECVVAQQVDAGDHRVILGLVTESVMTGAEPLVFFRSQFSTVVEGGATQNEPISKSGSRNA